MNNEQWVPALDVYKSADEMKAAQRRGGRFSNFDTLGVRYERDMVFDLKIESYYYRLGSDPQEPASKHTKEQPMQPEPDRMAYLIECGRQVLDGKTLQWKWIDHVQWQTDGSIRDSLGSIMNAISNNKIEVRIKPEPVAYAPIYLELNEKMKVVRCGNTRCRDDTHKLTITYNDGKVSATVEELEK